MSVYAISDLHLPAKSKPMDIFGEHWINHFEKIKEDWLGKVTDRDIVLLPGDLTWAMTLPEAMEDIQRVGALPGKKILLRGNHDYWWSAIGQVRRALPENMFALQNDAMLLDGILFAGSRGWTIPASPEASEEDFKIYTRERNRLEMSLKAARRLSTEARLITLMHYPPQIENHIGFSDILSSYGVSDCVYGHLHGAAIKGGICGLHDGIYYHRVPCDGLDFHVYKLPDEDSGTSENT